MRVKHALLKFKNSSFICHMSFIWHPIRFFKCLRYPFVKVYNRWNGKFMGYSSTEDEAIPEGWRRAFGKDLLKDIKQAGKLCRKNAHKHLSWKKMLQFTEIKEKWGLLCLYASATDEIVKVLDKYEYLSQFYCIHCGKPTKYITKGYITYICKDCKEDMFVDKLSRGRDLVTITRFDKDDIVKVDVEKEYNIDLKYLTRHWGD